MFAMNYISELVCFDKHTKSTFSNECYLLSSYISSFTLVLLFCVVSKCTVSIKALK